MIARFTRKWAQFTVEKRWWVLLFSCLMVVASLPFFKNLHFDHSADMWFNPKNPNIRNYNLLRERFGDDQYLAVGIDARPGDKNIFTPDMLAMVSKITDFLSRQENVTKVSSIANYKYTRLAGGRLVSENLIPAADQLPADPRALDSLAGLFYKETPAIGYLATSDCRHTLVVARTAFKRGTIEHHLKLVKDLRAFLTEQKFSEQGLYPHVLGRAVISETFFTLNGKDQGTLYPLMYLIILVILLFAFRSKSAVILPLMMIFGSLIMTWGFQGLMGWSFNVVNISVPVLVMCIGIGDCVHVLVWFYRFRNRGDNSKLAVMNALEALWVPCSMQSVTAAVGFFAITLTDLPPLRQFGFIAMAGVAAEYVLSMLTLPAILTFTKRIPMKVRREQEGGFIHRVLEGLAPAAYKHRFALTAGGALLTGISIFLCLKLDTNTNFLDILRKDSDLRQSFRYFDKTYKYNGGLNLEFMLDAGKPGGALEPAFLRKALEFQEYLESHDQFGKGLSILNTVRRINQAMHGGNPRFYAIPDSASQVASYLAAYLAANKDNDVGDLLTPDGRHMRVTVSTKNVRTRTMNDVLAEINGKVGSEFAALHIERGGALALYTQIDKLLLDGLFHSFGFAALVIGICFLVLFRSVKYSLLALVPTIVPILAAGGAMYVVGLSLDNWSILIASITIGVAVDNAIHIIIRYLWARREGLDPVEGMRRSLTQAGRAVIYTNIVLIFGFGVLMLGTLLSTAYFGFFSALIMIAALVGSFVFMPAMIFCFDRVPAGTPAPRPVGRRQSVPVG